MHINKLCVIGVIFFGLITASSPVFANSVLLEKVITGAIAFNEMNLSVSASDSSSPASAIHGENRLAQDLIKVPDPAPLALLAMGMIGLILARRI